MALGLKRKIEGKASVKGTFLNWTGLAAANNQPTVLFCGEDFEEDWIECCPCQGWAHENCANLEGDDLFYYCDLCKLKKR